MKFKGYRKLERDEVIPANAVHSYDGGKLNPINAPHETVGDVPASFSHKREFYVKRIKK